MMGLECTLGPPLRVAKRATPHEALRNWLAKHEPAITSSPSDVLEACLPGSSADLRNPFPNPSATALPGRNPRLTARQMVNLDEG